MWCDANELQINRTKSSTMLITPKTNSSNLNIQVLYNNNLIECCESCKYLGAVLDKLNFKDQINLVENKLAKAKGILSKLRYLLPSSTLLLLYHAFVHPTFYMLCHSGAAPFLPISTKCNAYKIKQYELLPKPNSGTALLLSTIS